MAMSGGEVLEGDLAAAERVQGDGPDIAIWVALSRAMRKHEVWPPRP
jgi:hypothetical protein